MDLRPGAGRSGLVPGRDERAEQRNGVGLHYALPRMTLHQPDSPASVEHHEKPSRILQRRLDA